MSGPRSSSDEGPGSLPLLVMKDPLSYPRAMRPKSSGHGRIPTPGPDSHFYVQPASSKALRWSIVLSLIGPAVLAFAVLEFALAHEWTGLVIALVMLCTYGLLKWVQIRAILRELARAGPVLGPLQTFVSLSAACPAPINRQEPHANRSMHVRGVAYRPPNHQLDSAWTN